MLENFSSFEIAAVTIVVVLLSMTLHEAMHAFASYWLGDDTAKLEGRLSLNPLKHIDPVLTLILPVFLAFTGGPIFGAAKPVPFNPQRVKFEEFGAAIVGIAGPLTNLMLAVIGAGVLRVIGPELSLTGLPLLFLVNFIVVNIGFFVFNMIPLPPLDGSRLLYAFAPEPVQEIMRQIEAAGLMMLIVFMVILLPILSPLLQEVNQSILNFLLG